MLIENIIILSSEKLGSISNVVEDFKVMDAPLRITRLVHITQCNHCTESNKSKVHFKWIKTHGSELRGQEEAGCMQQTSELFTDSIAVKFVKALNKLPLKLLLSY